MEKAIKIIIAKSPNASNSAMNALQRIGTVTGQKMFNQAATMAFNDSSADFTPEERTAIAEYVSGTNEGPRKVMTIKLSDSERVELERQAEAEGVTAGEYIRRTLKL